MKRAEQLSVINYSLCGPKFQYTRKICWFSSISENKGAEFITNKAIEVINCFKSSSKFVSQTYGGAIGFVGDISLIVILTKLIE